MNINKGRLTKPMKRIDFNDKKMFRIIKLKEEEILNMMMKNIKIEKTDKSDAKEIILLLYIYSYAGINN